MREIKFRARRKPPKDFGPFHFTSEMVYGTGFLKDPVNTWLICNDEKQAIAFGQKQHIINPETVGQFTGVLDKNGKEIYEGDVLEYGDSRFIVAWDNEHAKVNCYFADKPIKEYYCPLHDSYIKESFEIIGNIHENPELLERP